MSSELVFYGNLPAEIKTRIRQAQSRAALSANAKMITMYDRVEKDLFCYR